MQNSNKIIIILLTIILISGTILGIKIYKSKNESEVVSTNSTYIEDTIKDKNNSTIKNSVNLDKLSSKNENIYANLVVNIINLVIIMAVIPILLRKFNLLICVTIMTIYRILLLIIVGGNIFALGIVVALIVLAFTFIYYLILLWLIEKLLLDINPIAYFFGVLFFEVISSWGATFLLTLLLTKLLIL